MNLRLGVAHGHLTPTQPHPQLAASAAAANFSFSGGAATLGGGGCSVSVRSVLRWPSSASVSSSIRAEASGSGSAATAAAEAAEAAAGFKGSFYDLLGIPESGSLEEIKRAYKEMALRYHPDVSPPDRAAEYTQRFIAVQEAYETLSDPSRRALYDRDLAKGLHLFSSRRKFDEELVVKPSWRNHWQGQLAGLKKRSPYKESEENISWAAHLRRLDESSTEQHDMA